MRKKVFLLIAILIAVVTAVMLFVFPQKNSHLLANNAQQNTENNQDSSDLNYGELIKPEDRAAITPKAELINKGDKIKIPILMYHHVGVAPANANATRKDLTVSPEEFEQQVAWLSKTGYTSVTLDDLYQYTQKKKTAWPTKPVIFTFDDGYVDVFENAVPILNKYNFSGAFGIITGYVGQTQGDNVYGTWSQISDAKTKGMEIVCHTQNHFDGTNPKFDPAYIFGNLTGCQDDITAHLGTNEPYLIYPYGHYTDEYITQAKRAGFVMGLTVHGGSTVYTEDLMRIPRVRVHPNEPLDKFIKRLSE